MAENSHTFTTYEQFWPFYLSQHSQPLTRGLHILGTLLGLAALFIAIVTFSVMWLVVAPVLGYGFAWIAHMTVEKNRPATFIHPLWSLRGDFHMLKLFLRGELETEIVRHKEHS